MIDMVNLHNLVLKWQFWVAALIFLFALVFLSVQNIMLVAPYMVAISFLVYDLDIWSVFKTCFKSKEKSLWVIGAGFGLLFVMAFVGMTQQLMFTFILGSFWIKTILKIDAANVLAVVDKIEDKKKVN